MVALVVRLVSTSSIIITYSHGASFGSRVQIDGISGGGAVSDVGAGTGDVAMIRGVTGTSSSRVGDAGSYAGDIWLNGDGDVGGLAGDYDRGGDSWGDGGGCGADVDDDVGGADDSHVLLLFSCGRKSFAVNTGVITINRMDRFRDDKAVFTAAVVTAASSSSVFSYDLRNCRRAVRTIEKKD